MKILINLIILGLIIAVVYWNNFLPSSPSSLIKSQVVNPTPAEQVIPPPLNLEESREELYQKALVKQLPQKLIALHNLAEDLRLALPQEQKLEISQDKTDTQIITQVEWQNQNLKFNYYFSQDLLEASYTVDHEIYPFDVILMVNNEVVLQFNGHINKNFNPGKYQDLDVIAYEPGDWEKIINNLPQDP